MAGAVRLRHGRGGGRLPASMAYCYWLPSNTVTICSQQKKKDGALVVIPSILLHPMKAAMLWPSHTSFATGGWRAVWPRTGEAAEAIGEGTGHAIGGGPN